MRVACIASYKKSVSGASIKNSEFVENGRSGETSEREREPRRHLY